MDLIKNPANKFKHKAFQKVSFTVPNTAAMPIGVNRKFTSSIVNHANKVATTKITTAENEITPNTAHILSTMLPTAEYLLIHSPLKLE